jgi:hypothetical protein
VGFGLGFLRFAFTVAVAVAFTLLFLSFSFSFSLLRVHDSENTAYRHGKKSVMRDIRVGSRVRI